MTFSPEGEVVTRTQIESIVGNTVAMQPEGELAIEMESMVVAESGDLAYGTGTTTLEGTDSDGQPFIAKSRWLAGFKRVGGEWKIDRLMTSAPTSAAELPSGAGEPADTIRISGPDTTPRMR